MYVCMYVCMYVRMYVCMYVCMYGCMYVYIYTYIYLDMLGDLHCEPEPIERAAMLVRLAELGFPRAHVLLAGYSLQRATS